MVDKKQPLDDPEILQAIRQMRQTGDYQAIRQSVRYEWNASVKTVFLSPRGFQELRFQFIADGVDISSGGCSLITKRYLLKGTCLLIELPLGNTPVIEGRVTYCRRYPDNTFRIGVEFVGRCSEVAETERDYCPLVVPD